MCDGPCNFSSNRLLVSLLAQPRGVKLAESWKMALTSGCKLLILLKPKPLRGLSQSVLITSLTVTLNLGEDSDFVNYGKMKPLSVTHRPKGDGGCALVANLFIEETTQSLAQNLTL